MRTSPEWRAAASQPFEEEARLLGRDISDQHADASLANGVYCIADGFVRANGIKGEIDPSLTNQLMQADGEITFREIYGITKSQIARLSNFLFTDIGKNDPLYPVRTQNLCDQ